MARNSYLLLVVAFMTLELTVEAQFQVPLSVDGVAASNFGCATSSAGDVNGDGHDDLIVGSWLEDNGFAFNAGNAKVFSGADGTLLHNLKGVAAFDLFGFAVAAAGDVNADGFDDVAIGAIGAATNGSFSGSVRVHSGVDGVLLYEFLGNAAFDAFGSSVSGNVDINNDGYDDIMVGAIGSDNNGESSGSVYIFSGLDGSQLTRLDGDAADDQFGVSVSGVGDVNFDGFADLVVGANQETRAGVGSGKAYLISGADGSRIYSKSGLTGGALFGDSVSRAGDLDCDGIQDFMVGAPEARSNGPKSGTVRVYSGATGAELFVFHGDSSLDRLGQSVDAAGDVNGDGFDDVIAGAPLAASGTGFARVFSGQDGSVYATFLGDSAGDQFGFAVGGAGDLDQDGFDDIVVGAPFDDNTGQDAGLAKIYLATSMPVLHFSTESDFPHLLHLKWLPNADDPQAHGGALHCSGATPGGLGDFGVSLKQQDTLMFGFLPLLIDIEAPHFLNMGKFGFDSVGELTATGVSRQNAALAGLSIYIQMFQTAPLGFSSNAIRIAMIP